MKAVTCIEVIGKNTSNSWLESSGSDDVAYILQDSAGKQFQVSAKKLKLLLSSNKIQVVNLLLSNNEIIPNPKYEIESTLAKLRMLGELEAIDTTCGHQYYIAKCNDEVIFYIPDYVTTISSFNPSYDWLNLYKNIKIVGGKGLTGGVDLFYKVVADSIDLSLMDTSNMITMRGMFQNCKAKYIDLSNLNTSKVSNMGHMFARCILPELNLNALDISNVNNMEYMFAHSEINSLDISKLNTSSVKNMHAMFWDCKAKSINLGSFDTSNVVDKNAIFFKCKANIKSENKEILKQIY